MYSHRSDHSRQYGERRHRDPVDEHWEKHEAQRNSYRKYGGSVERTSRSREYGDSPRRQYSTDSVSREKRRKSPFSRRLSSPDWGASEKKRRRLTEDEDHYRYRHSAEAKTSRQPSPESPKRTRSSRQGHHHEEFAPRRRCEDGGERTRGCPRTQTPARDASLKNGKRDISDQKAGPDENKPSKGFQRFLDILNRGVNVATLTKIMTSVTEDDGPESLAPPLNTKDQPPSPPSAAPEQEFGQNPYHRSEEVEFWRRASSENPHEPLPTPKESPRSDERPPQPGDGDQSHSSSGSLPHLDKMRLTPEEEHKHKQAQHILQAIGVNLEFEELGQMSHRIQERLYGKKDGDRGRAGQQSREGDTVGGLSPKLHNRSSSSSRTSCSPSPRKSKTKDSHSFPQVGTEEQHHEQVRPSLDYGRRSSSDPPQESPHSGLKSWENTFTCQSYSQSPAYSLPEPRPVSTTPVYSPPSAPGLPFPALLPNLSQPGAPLCFPPAALYPRPPPVNVFPAVLAQMRPLLPPFFANPVLPPLNPPQKPKPLSRPRCLQVIETKQPS